MKIDLLTPYRKYGEVISQADGDQGDSCQRECTYAVLSDMLGLLEGFDRLSEKTLIKNAFTLRSGKYRRSPDPSYWGSNPNNFSRDQHSILNLAFAQLGMVKELNKSMWSIIKRFGFMQNVMPIWPDENSKKKIPDFVAPNMFAVWIRGSKIRVLYPLLQVLDIGFLLDLIFRKNNLWDYDNMLAQNLFYALDVKPTVASKLAWKFYQKTNYLECIKKYHVRDNGVAPLYDLFLANAIRLQGGAK